jgi:hypothetical protein
MNYSFILDEKNKINIDELTQSIDIEIIGKDPKNLIKENISFINEKNIIKLPDGDEMSKMIIGKALKNDNKLKADEKREIEFAKKYQILSKNTALFAEILNDSENKQTKLIKVNLNDYETQRIGDVKLFSGGFRPMVFSQLNAAPRSLGMVGCARPMVKCCKAMPMMERSAMPKKKMAKMDEKIGRYEMNSCAPVKNIIANNNNNPNEVKDELTRLIMSQDIIEGTWNENEETKKIINIITQDKFNKISNKVKGLNKGMQEIKIIYTLLVIFYLNIKHSDKLNDYRLVINKSKKYLMSQGIKYEEFIVGI